MAENKSFCEKKASFVNCVRGTQILEFLDASISIRMQNLKNEIVEAENEKPFCIRTVMMLGNI